MYQNNRNDNLERSQELQTPLMNNLMVLSPAEPQATSRSRGNSGIDKEWLNTPKYEKP